MGPAAGFLATVVFVQRAFGRVATADPSEKARLLAEGISEAMNCAIAGLVVGLLGAVVFGISLASYLRRREKA